MKARRVLLCEDDPGSLTLLSGALGARGITVHPAATVTEALALAADEDFYDAVVSDIVLADRPHGGLELVAELRARAVGAPVILVTAFADKERLKRAIELRVAHLLEKPFSADQLLSVLNRVWADPGDLTHYAERAIVSAGLTPKEGEVARLVLKGLSNDEIARALDNSDKTIRQHLSAVYAKCGVASRAEFFHHVFPT